MIDSNRSLASVPAGQRNGFLGWDEARWLAYGLLNLRVISPQRNLICRLSSSERLGVCRQPSESDLYSTIVGQDDPKVGDFQRVS